MQYRAMSWLAPRYGYSGRARLEAESTIGTIRDDCYFSGAVPADHTTAKELLESAHKAVSEAKIPKPLEVVAFGKAFDFLAGGAPAPPQPRRHGAGNERQEGSETQAQGLDLSQAEEFFTSHQAEKPHENARLAAAYHYSLYGSSPFSLDDIRSIGEHVGLTLPERIDMTLGSAKTGGKSLFKSAGRGHLQPTVHGEAHMKTEYNVKKGTRKRS